MAFRNASLKQLHAEINRRKAGAARLQKKRDKLAAHIATVDAEMAELGISASNASSPTRSKSKSRSAAPRKRAKNTVTLDEALAGCTDVGAVVSPQEAAKLVKRNGYKSQSATFGGQVANALSKHPKFKKAGRAQYERVK